MDKLLHDDMKCQCVQKFLHVVGNPSGVAPRVTDFDPAPSMSMCLDLGPGPDATRETKEGNTLEPA